MPATTGITFVITLANVKQEMTISGSGNYTLTFEGEETGTLTEASNAAAIETALEGLASIGANEVAVSGAGPFEIEFGGGSGTKFSGQDPAMLAFKQTSGTVAGAMAKLTPADIDYFAVAGQRDATLNRGTDTADASDKDAPGWPNEIPLKRNWSVDFDQLVIETDAGQQALEDAWLNKQPVHCRITTPASNFYSGSGTLENFSFAGPHDGLFMATGSLAATTSLVKTA